MLRVALLAFNYWMHPYVTLQRLLTFIFILAFSLPTFVTGTGSKSCIGDVKEIELHVTKLQKFVLVKQGTFEVIANDTGFSNLYQISIGSNTMMFYHPHTRRFICWSMHYNYLQAKVRPDQSCEFHEEVASDYDVLYTSINPTNPSEPAILRFNMTGHYPKGCMRKLKKRMRVNKDTKYHCGYEHILPRPVESKSCSSTRKKFCRHMRKLKKEDHLPSALKDICEKQKKIWNRV